MPWVGASIGVERFTYEVDFVSPPYDLSYQGVELGLQGGADFRLGDHFAAGPWLGFGFGTYDNYSIANVSGVPDTSGSLTNTSSHSWFTVGAKGTVTF